MAVLNNFKKDFRIILAQEELNQSDVAEKTGKKQAYISVVTSGQIVKKGLVDMYEELGYDIEVRYIKREPKNE